MNYQDEDPGRFDEVVDAGDGVRIVVDPRALLTVVGTQVDWREDALAAQFVFENPNAKDVCGCGESFST